ncbi:transferase [Proteus columbae]|uniref:transferase n=1 Tax=Proteus columbae TaxID=1987580 RepID=UPI0018C5E114|nr:transferase [Proteus columbae]MBG6025917.1 transferase [Proteus mirabilis]MBG6046703.1 transferase [Proteus mirabilis]
MEYKFTNKSKKYNGITLFRIRRIPSGTLGGWIESENNLSQKGDCFIFDDAMVFGDAKITGNTVVKNSAQVYGNAIVKDNSSILGNTKIYGNAFISGNAQVSGSAVVYDNASIMDNAQVSGNAAIYDNAVIKQQAKVSENAIIRGYAQIEENADIGGDVIIEGNTVVSKDERIYDTFGSWDQIGAIRDFSFYDLEGNTVVSKDERIYNHVHFDIKKEIYANGKHQVPIYFSMYALDKSGRNIKIPPEEMYKNIKFIDKYKNPLKKGITISNHSLGYVHPTLELIPLEKHSAGIWYVSIDANTDIERIKIYAQCHVNGEEYNTISDNAIYDNFISISVLPKRKITYKDIDTEPFLNPRIDKLKGGYGGKITKYYLRFTERAPFWIRNVECEEGKTFYHVHDGNYQQISTSTDLSFEDDISRFYTKEFHFKDLSPISVTSDNSGRNGVCFWSYSIYFGKPFTYSKKEEEMNCTLFDQYGHDVNIVIKADNNNDLIFEIKE